MPSHAAIVPGPAVRGFVIRLVGGILAVVALGLGVPFLVIGLVDTAQDADAFRVIGATALALGIALGVAALLAGRRARRTAAAELAARTSRTTATVTEAELRLHSRVGGRHPLRLGVRFAGALAEERHVRTFYALPVGIPEPGDRIEIAFDPENPANFAPVAG